MTTLRVLVTGASGFVGRTLVPLLARRHAVRAASRQPTHNPGMSVAEQVKAPELGPAADWTAALRDIDVVVHLAAIAHVPPGDAAGSQVQLDKVNVAGTVALARQAAASGVSQFVFLSSIKAVADHSSGQPLSPFTTPAPEDAYGRAKLAAERELWRVCGDSDMRGLVLRPPMIYGPQAKGNLAVLSRWVARGIPLPFGAVSNRRSLLSLWHLCDIIDAALVARVAGQVLHVCDPEPVSTPALIQAIAAGLGRRARLMSVPPWLLRAGLRVGGRRDLSQRLLGSLELEGSLTWSLLGIAPRHTTIAGLERAIRDSWPNSMSVRRP